MCVEVGGTSFCNKLSGMNAELDPLPSEKGKNAMNPDAYERVILARHPERPYTLDYVQVLFEDFFELRGDRRFADDAALVAGFAEYHGEQIAVLGQQKGKDTKQRRYRNFAMPKPEGYRKAARLMFLAEKFNRPIISFIDTPGAYPGIDAEERGQAEAIANNLLLMSRLSVPIISVIIGEGGSGGALAIGVGDSVLMFENAIYSVISPEGCAAILWKDSTVAPRASEALKLTAIDLYNLGVVDKVITEPAGGAHLNLHETAIHLEKGINESLLAVKKMGDDERIVRRYRKLRRLGLM